MAFTRTTLSPELLRWKRCCTRYEGRIVNVSYIIMMPSLDLNPIEIVWQVVKDKVEKLEHAYVDDWKTTIQQTWASLDDLLYLNNFIYSMPRT